MLCNINKKPLKLTYIGVIVLVAIIIVMLAGCDPGDGDTLTTVYTPRGTAVSAYQMNWEMTSSEIQQLNNYVASNYPNAIRVRDATRKYNCHSYAWHNQSSNNNIWIN